MARLFNFLAVGERVARDCARRQSTLATQQYMQRFFLSQSRHESAHVWVFENVARWLDAKAAPVNPAVLAILDYGRLVEDAIECGQLDEAILAQQLILEGLGDVVLDRVSFGIGQRALGFERIRHIMLGQEHAHYRFGKRWAEDLASHRPELIDNLSERAVPYLEMIDQILHSLGGLFEVFDEDEAAYRARLRQSLPVWIQGAHVF